MIIGNEKRPLDRRPLQKRHATLSGHDGNQHMQVEPSAQVLRGGHGWT